jgi:anion-transporting  ArsA/GET3 family ATPase
VAELDPAVADLLSSSRVIVLLGAGGVGKTTTSVTLALAAAQAGRRVALLSIDPAKRLAAALGMPLSGTPKPLVLPAAGGFRGTLAAAMLDQKEVFDAMVRRHAPSEAVALRIMAHPAYKAASTKLSGPLEYMALAKLQDLANDPQYDLVVLDTPPDDHALDFLARPNILAGFADNKVMTWLVRPFLIAGKLGLGRMLSAGEKLMGGVAKVTGVTALHSFADFLVLIQEVIDGFHLAGEKTAALLRQPSTRFIVVTIATRSATRGALHVTDALRRFGYRTAALLINRLLPAPVSDALRRDPASAPVLAKRLAGETAVSATLATAIKDAQRFGLPETEREPAEVLDLLALAHQIRALT